MSLALFEKLFNETDLGLLVAIIALKRGQYNSQIIPLMSRINANQTGEYNRSQVNIDQVAC